MRKFAMVLVIVMVISNSSVNAINNNQNDSHISISDFVFQIAIGAGVMFGALFLVSNSYYERKNSNDIARKFDNVNPDLAKIIRKYDIHSEKYLNGGDSVWTYFYQDFKSSSLNLTIKYADFINQSK